VRAGVRPRVGEKYPFNFELDFGRFWSTDEEIDTLIPIRNKSLPGVPINGKNHYCGYRFVLLFSA
jgi:hypothetical protein|tara:strand:+ start:322 stop:516 length:195 start_codon:yes stop_codon:yes gene_type:complete